MDSRKTGAVIMAAGTSSRFVPLSLETPKGLLEVKGEVLVERQIRQLREAGVDEITVVTGYMADRFDYLRRKFGVETVFNEDFARYNNSSSLLRVADRLGDTYICSSDNYFPDNLFLEERGQSYYSALYAEGETKEYCLSADSSGNITGVTVGGRDSWYMIGHAYMSEEFGSAFGRLLVKEYAEEATRLGYWEDLYIRHIGELPPMGIRRRRQGEIEEFDSLDELRAFDSGYLDNTRSAVVKNLAARLGCRQSELRAFRKHESSDGHPAFTFRMGEHRYLFETGGEKLTSL